MPLNLSRPVDSGEGRRWLRFQAPPSLSPQVELPQHPARRPGLSRRVRVSAERRGPEVEALGLAAGLGRVAAAAAVGS